MELLVVFSESELVMTVGVVFGVFMAMMLEVNTFKKATIHSIIYIAILGMLKVIVTLIEVMYEL